MKKKKRSLLIYGIICIQLGIYACVFLINPHEPAIHVKNFIDRLYLHVSPLAIYAIAVDSEELLK